MKKSIVILYCLILVAGSSPAQVIPDAQIPMIKQFTHLYQACEHEVNVKHHHKSWAKLAAFMQAEKDKLARSKNEEHFLYMLFYKVHNRFLKNYKQYSHFHDLATRGNYDCLTGTLLYGLILEELGIDYTIRESEYHIYLLVNLNKKQYIFEATDPFEGFVSDPVEVARREKQFESFASYASSVSKENKEYIRYELQTKVFNQIGMSQLVGLYYYNLAIESFNTQRFQHSSSYMLRGLEYYPSNRMYEFYDLVVREQSRFGLSSKVE